jgi:hypothetical protein
MAALLKSSEAFKAISHHISLWSQMFLRPAFAFDGFFSKSDCLAEANNAGDDPFSPMDT